ncbi:hypothetical protein A85_10610 [Streptococcus pyogenes]|nr:hypothetical protein A85_10610 [Streptococcus pyogenes]
MHLIGNFYFSKKNFGSAENHLCFLLSKVGSKFPNLKTKDGGISNEIYPISFWTDRNTNNYGLSKYGNYH